MEKKKLTSEGKERLKKFLEHKKDAIIEAELATYKEIPVSEHSSRVYAFSTLTMSIIQINSSDIEGTIREALNMYKSDEYEKLDDERRMVYNLAGGSQIVALLAFLPAKAVIVDGKKEDQKEMYEMLKDITLDDMTPEKFEELGIKLKNTITVHYCSFYTNNHKIYEMVVHNDEILDLFFTHEVDLNKEGMKAMSSFNLSNFIEVE